MKDYKNRKLQGSVLLTVVFVMAILIVFLFGTLTLALSAHNRAHVNYSTAQTEITARSVAESAIKALENNTELGKKYQLAVAGLKEGDDPIELSVQLDAENTASLGDIDNVVISHAGKRKYYDLKLGSWQERDLLKFTATANLAGVEKSSSVYVIKHYKEDKVTTSRGGAGFITTADALLTCQTSIFGGAYVALPNEDAAEDYELYYLESYDERMQKRTFNTESHPIVKLYNNNAVIEMDLVVNNHLYIENWSGFVFPGEGKGLTVWGDLEFSPNAYDHLEYIFNGLSSDDIDFNKVPYVYVDGKIHGIPKLGNADQNAPMNTFCAFIETDRTEAVISSNVYCMDADQSSYIKGVKDPGMYTWSSSVITHTEDVSNVDVVKGEICSMGDLELSDVEIRGDVRVEGTLKITGDVTVHGNVVCNSIEGANKLKINTGSKLYTNKSDLSETTTRVDLIEYKPTQNESGVWVDAFDDPINDGKYFTNGAFNGEASENATDVKIFYHKKEDGTPDDSLKPIYDYDEFYNDNVLQDDKGFYYWEKDESEDTVENSISDFKELGKSKPNYYTAEIYPEYAKRENIIGKNPDKKVVRTLKEVLEEIANPYKYQGGTSLIQDFKKDVTDSNTASSLAEIVSKGLGTRLTTGADSVGTEEYKMGDVTYKKSSSTEEPGAGDPICITESCKLSGVTFNQPVVFDPGATDMIVIIDTVSFENDYGIYIDDTGDKKVYFYIEPGAALNFDQNPLLTKTYWDALAGTKNLSYNSSVDATYQQIEDLENRCPNVYIYGGEEGKAKSTLYFKNMNVMTMNVISPDIEAKIDGGTGTMVASMMYNGFEVMRKDVTQFIIGCFNVTKLDDAKNQLNVIYIPEEDSDADKDTSVVVNEELIYKTLYYSEF